MVCFLLPSSRALLWWSHSQMLEEKHKQKPKTGTVYIHTYMYVPEISLYYTHRSNINARICGPRRSLVVQLIVSRPSPPDFFLPVRHAIDHLLYKTKFKKKMYKILKPNILILYYIARDTEFNSMFPY